MRRVLSLALLVAVLLGPLAGCGRKGALEPPPEQSKESAPERRG